LIKVDWLAACIVLIVIGTVLVVFLQRWRKICTILQPMGSKGRYLKKSTKRCRPIRSKETWIKYTLLTLLSQRKLALNAKNTLLRYKSFEQLKNLKKNWPPPLFRPRTDNHFLKSQIHLVRQSL